MCIPLLHVFFVLAPSTAPTCVSVSEVTSTSITVQWGEVDCIHSNGDITGYTVLYAVQVNGSIQTVSVSGGGSTQTIISALTPSTNYSIEVAAVNSVGTGVYSNVIFQLTRGTCTHKHSKPLRVHIYFCALTVQAPALSVQSATATTISLSWTSAGSMVDIYEVMWQRDTSGDCPDQDVGSTTLTDSSTSYIITGLEQSSNYTITVIATNANVMEISNSVTGFTQESGAIMSLLVI